MVAGMVTEAEAPALTLVGVDTAAHSSVAEAVAASTEAVASNPTAAPTLHSSSTATV